MRIAGSVVRDFVTVVRIGVVATNMVRPMAHGVIVRGHPSIMVAQRHAQTRRCGRRTLDRDHKRQRESDQDAGEFWGHCREFYRGYSTVTDFARFLGLSTSLPRSSAVW